MLQRQFKNHLTKHWIHNMGHCKSQKVLAALMLTIYGTVNRLSIQVMQALIKRDGQLCVFWIESTQHFLQQVAKL